MAGIPRNPLPVGEPARLLALSQPPTEASLEAKNAERRLKNFQTDIGFRTIQAQIKLHGAGNYDDWRIEIEYLSRVLNAKPILKERQLVCPEALKLKAEKELWRLKSRALFRTMFDSLEPSARRRIYSEVDMDAENGAELWRALELEYAPDKAELVSVLCRKLNGINIADDDGDVIKYIDAFLDANARLKNIRLNGQVLPSHITKVFLGGLGDHEPEFVQAQKDKLEDPERKEGVDLRHIVGTLIARATL